MTETEINEAVARKLASHGNAMVVDENTVFKPATREVIYGLKDYCHDIKAAFEIVDKIKQEYIVVISNESGKWLVNMTDEIFEHHATTADTAPMAICLAFLKLTEDKNG